MQCNRNRTLFKALAIFASLALMATSASATHAWGSLHWARTTNPFTIKLGDNVNGRWAAALASANTDWSASTVLNTQIVSGNTHARTCLPTAGQVEVCNSKYGDTGWLGLTQLWADGDHITQATVKLNDTYFNTKTYAATAWRNETTCHEIGHTFGLAHQDEDFNNANLGSCLDFTSDPETNQHPNQHDYEMLQEIYGHTDSTPTVNSTVPMPAAMLGRNFDRQSSWGQMIKRSRDGARETYERDFGNGFKIITHVFWALQEGGPAHRQQRANEE